MAELDIPKRVVVVLLFLTILVSFIGTLAFLQFYTSMPKPQGQSSGVASAEISILPDFGASLVKAGSTSDDQASVSVKIIKYAG